MTIGKETVDHLMVSRIITSPFEFRIAAGKMNTPPNSADLSSDDRQSTIHGENSGSMFSTDPEDEMNEADQEEKQRLIKQVSLCM